MSNKEMSLEELRDRIYISELLHGMYLAGDVLLRRADNIGEIAGRVRRTAPKPEDCDTPELFFRADSCMANHVYDIRYGRCEGGCYLSEEELTEIDIRIRQMHNGVEELIRKINSMEKILSNKM